MMSGGRPRKADRNRGVLHGGGQSCQRGPPVGKLGGRVWAALAGQLDRLIPEDEGVPLRGATFADFEDQVEALAREALPVVLPERAAEAVVLAE